MASQTLQAELDAKKTELTGMVGAEMIAKFAENVPTLEKRWKPSPPAIGDVAPLFSLPNQLGNTIDLSNLLTVNNYVIIVWYRGSWCPYCNVALKAWRDRIPEMQELGATFVAVSAETADESLDFRQKTDLTFHVLTDDGCEVGEKYGIAYEIGEDMLDTHSKIGVKFHEINGNANSKRTPKLTIPATFVVGKCGKVVFSEAMTDYTKRTDPAKVLNHLKSL